MLQLLLFLELVVVPVLTIISGGKFLAVDVGGKGGRFFDFWLLLATCRCVNGSRSSVVSVVIVKFIFSRSSSSVAVIWSSDVVSWTSGLTTVLSLECETSISVVSATWSSLSVDIIVRRILSFSSCFVVVTSKSDLISFVPFETVSLLFIALALENSYRGIEAFAALPIVLIFPTIFSTLRIDRPDIVRGLVFDRFGMLPNS
mmetsp:Transcript_1982/g.2477  ORF Transcript_1982/g.2477 Transcript_1982/m.2477 type:complete len:202 (+) Transcript_1982:856-1461(+)